MENLTLINTIKYFLKNENLKTYEEVLPTAYMKRTQITGSLIFLILTYIALFPKAAPLLAQSPTIAFVSPEAQVECTAGDSVTFTISAADTDGNLRGAEWYGNPASPSKVMLTMVTKTHAARMSKEVNFPDPGSYEITVSAFDTDYNYSPGLKWTVKVSPPAHANPLTYRSLYVDNFDSILGDSAREQELLDFLKKNELSEIALYGLYPVLKEDSGYAARTAALRSFISRARSGYGLKAVKGIGCLNSDFDSIGKYNDSASGNERFNGLLSEYEYWNSGEENFAGFISLLTHMREVADEHDLTVEAYLGWLGSTGDKQDEADKIAALTDIIYLHAYRADPLKTYGYISDRLSVFSRAEPGLRIRPIFSAEWRPLDICSKAHTTGVDNMCFMGKWFEDNTIRKAENIFMDLYYFYESSLPEAVTMDGYQYFAYSFLKEALKSGSGHLNSIHYLLLSRPDTPQGPSGQYGLIPREYAFTSIIEN